MADQDHKPRSARLAAGAIVAAVILSAGIGGGLGAVVYERNADVNEVEQISQESHHLAKRVNRFAKQLRNGLVKSCEKNGNAVREILRERIEEEIERESHLDLERLFPSYDQAKLRRLVRKGRRADQRDVGRLHPINCAARYPRP